MALVVVDYLTRWPEVTPLKDGTAHTVAKALLHLTAGRWGIPRAMISDQGASFTAAVIKAVYTFLGITRLSSAPYNARTDGLVENYNKILKDTIRKMLHDLGGEWDELIPYALFNCRATVHSSTQETPFFFHYGL